MRRTIQLGALPVCLALAACSGQQQGGGSMEEKDVEIAAVFTVPSTGVSCIRITASNAKRTSSTDFGVTPGAGTASFAIHGVPTGEVVFAGAAYSDPCAFAFLTGSSPPSWVADAVTATVTPGPASTNVTLRFRGSGNATVNVDFGDSTPYTVSTVAGNGTQGSADGFGAAARFEGPNGIALDGDNLYIVDRNLDNAGFPFIGMTVRRLTISTGQVTTLAGDPNTIGTDDGPGNVARFSRLRGIDVSGGLLYVIDGCALRTISTAPPFTVTTLVGTRRAPPNQANWLCGSPFGSLLDLVVRPSGVYVLDNGQFTVSRIDVSTSPPTITLVAGVPDVSGADDGTISEFSPGHFLFPNGLVFPFAGNDDIFYVGDSGNLTDTFYGFVRRVSVLEDSITTVAGGVHADLVLKDGLGTAAQFNSTRRIASDGNNLFVGDQPAIRRMDLASFAVTTVAGSTNTSGYRDGPGSSALLGVPNGLAIAPGGKIYFADQTNFVIRLLTP